MNSSWESIIGLEIHMQLKTKTKLFSSAANQFGNEPNQNISPTCTGQPGTLPLLNKEAVRLAVRFGLAIGASIQNKSSFDRKSYFYPDSPRNFQITQFFHPILRNGQVIVDVDGKEKTIFIESAHLEDDAGNLRHFSGTFEDFTTVDDNRAGAPLIEIVSQPCMRSAKEAVAYSKEIRSIFQYLDASDANMEQGHMRMDANISVREKGQKRLRNKVEIKNMNSFHFLELAIEEEIARQIAIYEKNPKAVIDSSTCRFDPCTKKLAVMRKKESSGDYRYMPEPDIPQIVLTDSFIEKNKSALPELPQARKKRYMQQLELSEESARILTTDKDLCDYFEQALALCSCAKMLCNWITVEFTGKLKEQGKTILSTGIPPSHLATLISLIKKGTITARMAKTLSDEMLAHPNTCPKQLIEKNPNYTLLNDPEALSSTVDQVLEKYPESIKDFKQGRKKAFAFLVGQVMKITKGTADPSLVTTLIHKKLDSNS